MKGEVFLKSKRNKGEDSRQFPYSPYPYPGYQPPYGPQPQFNPPYNFPPQMPPFPGGDPFPQQPPFSPPTSQAPTSPPPSFIPQKPQAGLFAIDPGAIRRCLFRFTYIWPERGLGFWFFPIFVGRNSVSGFRWTGFNWIFFGMDLRNINSFTCS